MLRGWTWDPIDWSAIHFHRLFQVWKRIKSKSVFTRTTDGQLLKYYTIYIFSGMAAVGAVALMVYYLTADSGSGSGGRFKLGWKCQLAFYVPVAGLVLANVGFYWSSQRRMTKQLIYNRSMQHFQVK